MDASVISSKLPTEPSISRLLIVMGEARFTPEMTRSIASYEKRNNKNPYLILVLHEYSYFYETTPSLFPRKYSYPLLLDIAIYRI